MSQVESLRSRMVVDFIIRSGQGMYIKIGNSAENMALKSRCQNARECCSPEKYLSEEQAAKAAGYPTTLRKPEKTDYQLLLRHGYEVAEYTYCCHHMRGYCL